MKYFMFESNLKRPIAFFLLLLLSVQITCGKELDDYDLKNINEEKLNRLGSFKMNNSELDSRPMTIREMLMENLKKKNLQDGNLKTNNDQKKKDEIASHSRPQKVQVTINKHKNKNNKSVKTLSISSKPQKVIVTNIHESKKKGKNKVNSGSEKMHAKNDSPPKNSGGNANSDNSNYLEEFEAADEAKKNELKNALAQLKPKKKKKAKLNKNKKIKGYKNKIVNSGEKPKSNISPPKNSGGNVNSNNSNYLEEFEAADEAEKNTLKNALAQLKPKKKKKAKLNKNKNIKGYKNKIDNSGEKPKSNISPPENSGGNVNSNNSNYLEEFEAADEAEKNTLKNALAQLKPKKKKKAKLNKNKNKIVNSGEKPKSNISPPENSGGNGNFPKNTGIIKEMEGKRNALIKALKQLKEHKKKQKSKTSKNIKKNIVPENSNQSKESKTNMFDHTQIYEKLAKISMGSNIIIKKVAEDKFEFSNSIDSNPLIQKPANPEIPAKAKEDLLKALDFLKNIINKQ